MELLSKKAIITSAPAQNREGFEYSIERVMPLLASRRLNLLAGNQNYVDFWNNYGAKMDALYMADVQNNEPRAEYGQRILDNRYAFLEAIGLLEEHEDRLVVSDDSTEMMHWIYQRLERLVSKGVICKDYRDMYVCDGCEKTIGIVTERDVSRLRCQTCGELTFHEERRDAIFMNVDVTPPNIVLPRKSRHVASHSANVPSSVAIERNRSYGLSLDCLDSEYVLDPKIALSMMYGYVSDLKANSSFLVLQGGGTLYNTAPYIQTVSPELEMRYVLTPNIPTGMQQDDIIRQDLSFVKAFLPLFLVDRTSDVSSQQILDLKRELANAKAYMVKMMDTTVDIDDEVFLNDIESAYDMLRDIHDIMNQGRVREGIMMTRNKLIKHMGSRGLFGRNITNHPKIDMIKKEVALIYGE